MSQSYQCQLKASLQQTAQPGDTIPHHAVLPEKRMVSRPWGAPRDACAGGLTRKAPPPWVVSAPPEGTAASGEHGLVIRIVT